DRPLRGGGQVGGDADGLRCRAHAARPYGRQPSRRPRRRPGRACPPGPSHQPGPARGEKEAPRFHLDALAEDARAGVHLTGNHARVTNDSWMVLTGCRQGAVPRALLADGPAAARRELDRLVAAFGRDRVLVELWDHGDPLDRHRNDALATVAARV